MKSGIVNINCQLTGIRPLMFDRYSGDNGTQLQASEKMYLTQERYLVLPAINLYSMLCSNNDSAVTRKFGRTGKTIALGIKSFTSIVQAEIPIFDDSGWIKFTGWNEHILLHYATTRVKKGPLYVPQPKERPMLMMPWYIRFDVRYAENKFCSLENLRQAYEFGGILGLGTFRPYFGLYEMTEWKVE